MEKSQDRFNYARDGQVKLHIWGLDTIMICLNFEKVKILQFCSLV